MSADIKQYTLAELKTLEKAIKKGELDKYLENCLSVEYETYFNSDTRKLEHLGANVVMAVGGPSIVINTRFNVVKGAWWADNCSFSYQDEHNELYSIFQEQFEALR